MATQLFVACRTFKTQGRLITAGDVFTQEELHQLKYYKSLLFDRRIKPVPQNEEELKVLQDYFRVRWGTDFAKNLAERVSKGSSSAETGNTGASATPTTPGTDQGPAKGTVQGPTVAPGAPRPLSGVPPKK